MGLFSSGSGAKSDAQMAKGWQDRAEKGSKAGQHGYAKECGKAAKSYEKGGKGGGGKGK